MLDVKDPEERKLVGVLPDGRDEFSLLRLRLAVRLGEVDDLVSLGTGGGRHGGVGKLVV